MKTKVFSLRLTLGLCPATTKARAISGCVTNMCDFTGCDIRGGSEGCSQGLRPHQAAVLATPFPVTVPAPGHTFSAATVMYESKENNHCVEKGSHLLHTLKAPGGFWKIGSTCTSQVFAMQNQ